MRSTRTVIYAVLTLVAAAGMCAFIAIHFSVTAWLPLAVLAILTLVSENFAFELPVKGSVSLSFAMVYAALLLDGPLAGVVCAIAGAMTLEEVRSRVPMSARVFNFGQLILSAGAAGLAYLAAGGQELAAAEWPTAINLPAALAAALAF
mgnify:FL=1